MKIYTRKQIQQIVDIHQLIKEIEQGLILFSQKRVLTAPSSFLHFQDPPGDVHIKSAAIENDDLYVIKIASGFYDNPKLKLPSSNGLMLLFSQKTGELKAILLDEGYLTNLRTGIAGAIAAKYLANPVTKIGIIGSGTQAREQLYCLQFITPCREVLVWGRNSANTEAFVNDPRLSAYHISKVNEIKDITQNCNLIVTVTNSTNALLFGHDILPGTHITAIGADEKGKQELDATVFEKADLISVDSISQCCTYGDLSHVKNTEKMHIVELGSIIQNQIVREKHWITIADLTGVAIEDLQIARSVVTQLEERKND